MSDWRTDVCSSDRDSSGLPPYNGGLFHEAPDDLLARIELRDVELAPLIDGLSRRPDLSGRGFINYRDLAVQHLGSIYERLLEQKRSEEHTSELQSLMRISYAVFCLKKQKNTPHHTIHQDE